MSVESGDHSEAWLRTFADAVGAMPEVMDFYRMAGDVDYMLRVVVADLEDYRRFQSTHLTRVNGIQNVKTDLPSEIVKQTYELPLR